MPEWYQFCLSDVVRILRSEKRLYYLREKFVFHTNHQSCREIKSGCSPDSRLRSCATCIFQYHLIKQILEAALLKLLQAYFPKLSGPFSPKLVGYFLITSLRLSELTGMELPWILFSQNILGNSLETYWYFLKHTL